MQSNRFPRPGDAPIAPQGTKSAVNETSPNSPKTGVDPVGTSEPVRDGRLTEDEVRFILNKTLAPQHRGDPNVIRFISSYLGCRNSRQAAQEAGLEPRSGLALRNRPDIHDAITEITQRSLIKYGYDANEIIERVKEIAGIDPVEFENPDGSYKTRLSDLRPEVRRAIKKFKVKNLYDDDPNGMKQKIGEIVEVELYDKMRSLELLGKEKKIFKDTVTHEHTVSHDMKNILLESKQRADQRFIERNVAQPIDVTPVPNDKKDK